MLTSSGAAPGLTCNTAFRPGDADGAKLMLPAPALGTSAATFTAGAAALEGDFGGATPLRADDGFEEADEAAVAGELGLAAVGPRRGGGIA
jgi:hypothetical protein